MFLKALTLKGFKSFADTTHLEFEPGVTVVVGPNGSGKSNVVDAIGWVLGAQAPSAVRSQKMEDVIFAGTSKRPALGRAEVALTLDNSSGLLPIEFSEVTVTRTLWRSGDSDYAINGAPCRLLDIQDLFSDTGVGRQQHVIVGQGQIDAVLNARPEERRSIIEEAAGVLKHRKRKERSERRLVATEANLQRLQDLQREVRRQLRPLERQAEAARRHGALVIELRALQVHLIGRELSTLQRRLAEVAAAKAEAGSEERLLREQLGQLDAQVLATEAELDAAGGHDISDQLAQAESLRQKAHGLQAVLEERQRSLERERASLVEGDVVAGLENDAAGLETDLETLGTEEVALAPDFTALEDEEIQLQADRQDLDRAEVAAVEAPAATEAAPGAPEAQVVEPQAPDAQTEMPQVPSPAPPAPDDETGTAVLLPSARSRAAEVRGELAALRASTERRESDLRQAQERLTHLEERIDRLAAESAQLGDEVSASDTAETELAEALEAAALARTATEAAASGADSEYREAAAGQHALQGRAEALALALDEARSRAGAEELAAVDGVVGTLLDLVEIDVGWEPAVEAACGEALSAVVVGSVEAGREAVRLLAKQDLPGAVLAVGAMASAGLPPAVGEPVRAHVRGRSAEVESLLDALLGRAVLVGGPALGKGEVEVDGQVEVEGITGDGGEGLSKALDVALAHPDAVVVTASGGRFAASGWRAVTATTGATGASLEATRRQAEAAEKAAVTARERHEEAVQASGAAREAHEVARRTLEEHRSGRSALVQRRERVERDHAEAVAEVGSVTQQLEDAEQRAAREQERMAELESLLPGLEAEQRTEELAEEAARRAAEEAEEAAKRVAEAAEEAARRAAEAAKREAEERARLFTDARRVLEDRAAALASRRKDLEVRRAQLADRRQFVSQRLDEVRARLARTTEAWETAQRRRGELDHLARVLDRLAGSVTDQAGILQRTLADLQAERQRQSEAQREVLERLDGLRRQRHASEGSLENVRERGRRAELDEAEVRLRLEQATDSCRSQFDIEPHTAIHAELPELPDGVPPAARVRELERELKLIGPVNPLALEEYEALQERYEFLQKQLEDVRASRRELNKVIRAVDDEIARVFAAAYADVSENFEQLFSTLFPGGQGRLRLTTPDELLTTGIEVEAKPSGKNVRKLSLLSGGERSLTALAFLFAVFRSRPSPFYVMDEVEAALDDVNLHRFLELVNEFRQEAQLVIVSHQKRTMEAAECLYGVTMQPGGSSKVVSEKVAA